MVGVFLADVDRTFTERELTDALAAVQTRHPFLRAQVEVVDDDYAFVEVGGDIPVVVRPLAPGEPVPVAEMQMWPLPEAPHALATCVYLPVTGEDRSVLALLMHHVFLDGSSGLYLMRQFLRALAGTEHDLDVSHDVPPALHSRFSPELTSARGATRVLGAIREERARAASAGRLPVPRPARTRHPSAARQAGREWRRLRCAARRRRRPRGQPSRATSARRSSSRPPRCSTTTRRTGSVSPSATHLRPRVDPPLPHDDMQLAIGLVCTPYLVSAETSATLGRDIGDQIRREVERGESHLFYRFARTAAYPPTDEGVAAFMKWVDSTPQNVTLSSTGLQDDTGDPPWVHSITATMLPGPNQLSFTSVTTYRGEMILNVSTDIAKLPPPLVDRLVEGVMARLGARRAQTTTYRPEARS